MEYKTLSSECYKKSDKTLIHSLASFANSLTLDTVPSQVLEEAKLCVLDTLGCILAGADTPEGQAFLKAEQQLVGDFETNNRAHLSPMAKARVLGYWGDIFELNDLIGGHASIGNVTAVLVAARNKKASGAELLRAVIAGIEITSRLGAAIASKKKPYEELGSVYVSMVSSFGASGAVSLIHKLKETEIGSALAISGAIANWGPAEVIFGEGGTIKPIQFGACPADTAIRAVGYAENGLTGPMRLIESKIGWLETFTNGYDPDVIRSNDTWYLLKPQRKLHACCGFTHSSIDAVVELRKKGIDFTNIKEIELGIPKRIVSAISKPNAPTTSNEARFHIQYCTALAASGIDIILPEHSINFKTYLGNLFIHDLMNKIKIKEIEESQLPAPVTSLNDIYNQSIIRLTERDNNIIEGICTAPEGSAGNPLSAQKIIDKFQQLTKSRFSSSVIDSCIERILSLEEQQECGWIDEMLEQSLDKYNFNGTKR